MSQPTLDITTLNHYTMSDKSLQSDLFDLFFGQTPELIATMQNNISGGTGWRESAHAMKGSAQSLGLIALGNILNRAENGERSEVIFNEIKTELKAAKEKANSYLVT